MITRPCPDCGKPISPSADVCPQCGSKTVNRPGCVGVTVGFIAFAIFIVLAILCSR